MIWDLFQGPQDLVAMVCLALLSLIPMICGLYVIIHYLSSLKHPKLSGTALRKPRNRIVVIIPAHNEEAVIRQAVQSALKSDYPKGMFDVIVIADNCTDDTAEKAREAGAIVHERFNPTVRSKAAALKWLFYNQGFFRDEYDAICILDADTLISRDFLRKLESSMQDGHAIVQGKGVTSNWKSGPVAYAMGLIESSQNRFWHEPMQRRDLSDLYTGKGVLISCAHLQRMGWHINTLVEDLEFSLQTILAGEKVQFCADAVFYSEQASDYGLFWRQQRRWTSGHIACSKMFIGHLHQEMTRGARKDMMPLLVYCLMPYSMAIGFVNIFLSPLLTAVATHLYAVSAIASVTSLVLQYIGVALYGAVLTRMDGRSISKNLKGIITMPSLTISLGLINLISLFSPKKDWEAMQHTSQELKTMS